MIFLNIKKIRQGISVSLVIVTTLCLILEGCFLFPPTKPIDKPDTAIVFTSFAPTLEWIQPTVGVVMDVNLKYIFSIGERRANGQNSKVEQVFNFDGSIASSQQGSSGYGLAREIVADDEAHFGRTLLSDIQIINGKNYSSTLSGSSGSVTNPYTRYNTVSGSPDIDPYPWSGYIYVIGPCIARGTRYTVTYSQTYISRSTWMIGTFTDNFQPDQDYFVPGTVFNSSRPTFGKADCFVTLYNKGNRIYIPVRHQWGGAENDLAYDVASDNIGNATIFLRAGSDFAITSATQSLVRMKTGYNIVRLDTNGLLTETFPVSLQATGELTDTQIALGKNGAVYILALDEAKKQYFLAKVNRSGTAWIRYFPPSVSDREKSIPSNRTARMGLTVDSKDCPYITGNFSGNVDLGGTTLSSTSIQAFVAKYSPTNTCLGALAMGSGLGVTVRLSPDETALYVNGWAQGSIMGTPIPSQDDPRNGVLRPGAFLVKLNLTK